MHLTQKRRFYNKIDLHTPKETNEKRKSTCFWHIQPSMRMSCDSWVWASRSLIHVSFDWDAYLSTHGSLEMHLTWVRGDEMQSTHVSKVMHLHQKRRVLEASLSIHGSLEMHLTWVRGDASQCVERNAISHTSLIHVSFDCDVWFFWDASHMSRKRCISMCRNKRRVYTSPKRDVYTRLLYTSLLIEKRLFWLKCTRRNMALRAIRFRDVYTRLLYTSLLIEKHLFWLRCSRRNMALRAIRFRDVYTRLLYTSLLIEKHLFWLRSVSFDWEASLLIEMHTTKHGTSCNTF